MLVSTLQTSLGTEFNAFIPYIIILAGGTFLFNYFSGSVMAFVDNNLMSSFTVRTDDETYNILMWWMTRQPFAHNTRNFVVNTSIYSRSDYFWRRGDESDEEDEDGLEPASDQDDELDGIVSGASKKHLLHFTPSTGTHWFWYSGVPLRFRRIQNNNKVSLRNPSDQEELSISCFGRTPRVLKKLLREARLLYLKKDDSKTIIYRATTSVSSYGSDSYWQRCMSRPSRPFSTVILPDEVKEELIADAADYLDPATRRWYANRGIPYRRGYLLHGPPGTGKSSLSLALAGYFHMKIYIVSLSGLTASEENLGTLFAQLPTNCVVLLEDIDTAGLTHTRDAPEKETKSDSTAGSGKLSLSGLLNILDGVSAQEGRVLIMTTNHLDNLDKALIRPGRVDMVVPFKLADADMSASIFRAIYSPYKDEHTSTPHKDTNTRRVSASSASMEKDALLCRQAEQVDKVKDLSETFASKIPEAEFSPAEIQGLLLRYKRSPQRAVDNVAEWVVQTRKDREEKKAAEAEKKRKADEEKKKADEKKADEKKDDEKKDDEKKDEKKDESFKQDENSKDKNSKDKKKIQVNGTKPDETETNT